MMVGGVIGPAVESLMVSAFGIHVVPVVLAGFAVLTLMAFASALRFSAPFIAPTSQFRTNWPLNEVVANSLEFQ